MCRVWSTMLLSIRSLINFILRLTKWFLKCFAHSWTITYQQKGKGKIEKDNSHFPCHYCYHSAQVLHLTHSIMTPTRLRRRRQIFTHEMGMDKRWRWFRLVPLTITDPVAPDSILNNVFCGCTTGCGSHSGCRKAGIPCFIVCGICHVLARMVFQCRTCKMTTMLKIWLLIICK